MVAELVAWKRVLEVTRDSLCIMEKSREHQEQNLQRGNQGKNQEPTRRDQFIEERSDCLADLQSSIHEILATADPDNVKLDSSSLGMLQLTAADFKGAILSFDYGETEKEVDKYVCLWDEWQLVDRRNAGAVARTCSVEKTLRGPSHRSHGCLGTQLRR